MSRRSPNGSEDEPTGGKCNPSSLKESEHQASLRSRNEQKRRLQIRTSCRRLCDLLPFVNGQLDTATTLELTARYMSYLKDTLPPNILSKVNEAVEENVSGLWKNIKRTQKKRRAIKLRSTSDKAKPSAEKSIEDCVSGRCTQQICKPVNQPSITTTSTLTMDQILQADGLTTVHAPPILLDKSSVPRGQMLPVCQDQFLSASFQSVENNWINTTSAFMNPTSCASTSAVMSHSFLPQMELHPSSSHVLLDVSPGLVDPVALRSVNSGQVDSPPEQTTVTNFAEEQSHIDSPPVCLPDSVPAVDFTNQPLFQSAMSSSDDLRPPCENRNQPVSDAVCHPPHESDLCGRSPLTESPQDAVSPFWLDLLLDANGNLSFPDANLVNTALSPHAGSN